MVAFELVARKLEPVITLRCGATVQLRTVRQLTSKSGQAGCDGSEVQIQRHLGTKTRKRPAHRVVSCITAAQRVGPVITLRCGATVQSPRHYAPCASSRLGAASPDATDQRFSTATSWYQDSDAAGSLRRLVHYSGTAGGGQGAGPGFAVPRFG